MNLPYTVICLGKKHIMKKLTFDLNSYGTHVHQFSTEFSVLQ